MTRPTHRPLTQQPRPPNHRLQHALVHTCASMADYWPYCWLCHISNIPRATPRHPTDGK